MAAEGGKSSWPELVGTEGATAVTTIKKERPDLAQVVTVPQDAMVTQDYRLDRVRVYIDAEGKVVRPPMVG